MEINSCFKYWRECKQNAWQKIQYFFLYFTESVFLKKKLNLLDLITFPNLFIKHIILKKNNECSDKYAVVFYNVSLYIRNKSFTKWYYMSVSSLLETSVSVSFAQYIYNVASSGNLTLKYFKCLWSLMHYIADATCLLMKCAHSCPSNVLQTCTDSIIIW